MKVIRFNEVKQITGLSRSTIDRLEAIGLFPKRIRLGISSVGWIEQEVKDWVLEKRMGGASHA